MQIRSCTSSKQLRGRKWNRIRTKRDEHSCGTLGEEELARQARRTNPSQGKQVHTDGGQKCASRAPPTVVAVARAPSTNAKVGARRVIAVRALASYKMRQQQKQRSAHSIIFTWRGKRLVQAATASWAAVQRVALTTTKGAVATIAIGRTQAHARRGLHGVSASATTSSNQHQRITSFPFEHCSTQWGPACGSWQLHVPSAVHVPLNKQSASEAHVTMAAARFRNPIQEPPMHTQEPVDKHRPPFAQGLVALHAQPGAMSPLVQPVHKSPLM
jgi:hypothetical protein